MQYIIQFKLLDNITFFTQFEINDLPSTQHPCAYSAGNTVYVLSLWFLPLPSDLHLVLHGTPVSISFHNHVLMDVYISDLLTVQT